jgi:hypothetical protein
MGHLLFPDCFFLECSLFADGFDVRAVLAAIFALMSAFDSKRSTAIVPSAEAEPHSPQVVNNYSVEDGRPAPNGGQDVVRIFLARE